MTKSEKIAHAVWQVRDQFGAKRIPHIFIADQGDGNVAATHAGSYEDQVALTATFIKGLTDKIKQDPKVFLWNVAITLGVEFND